MANAVETDDLTAKTFGETISVMRVRLLALVVLVPWLVYVVGQPLAELTVADQTDHVTSVANVWWVTEATLSDDPKGTVPAALCSAHFGDIAFEFARAAGFGRLAAEQHAVTKVVKIHERVCVYLI